MREQLRKAWAEIIQPDDYEAHMAAVGQVQANAHLVAEYLRAHWSKPGASILFVGAGTGQMFDFISPELLLPFSLTFTDINAGYLQRLAARLAAVEGLRYKTLVDDLESTQISRVFDLTAAILVLEHVDWRKAVSTLCALTTHEALVVIQENPPDLPPP
jgi:2-polyprenyl-3-methyl-5-hydroxy-6-metoxy-1,4-benzoquinol methylase